MQSRGARALVALGSIALIVVLFVVLSGGEEESGPAEEEGATATTVADPAGSKSEAKARPERPQVDRIVVVDGEPKSGVQRLTHERGDRVRLEVRSDVDDHVHVHGYDLFEDIAAGGKARFSFDADIDGVFEIELEDSGVQLAELRVRP